MCKTLELKEDVRAFYCDYNVAVLNGGSLK